MRPLRDNVLLRRLESPDLHVGGIVIPEVAQAKPQEATVIAIGPQVQDTIPGDRVLFSKYAGVTLKVKGVEHLILREADLIAVLG